MKAFKYTAIAGMLFCSGAAFSADLNSGLVAYYCFDDASNLAKDCSANNNHGAVEGNVTSSDGLIGGAATFGGYNNAAAIHVPNSSSLQFTDELTVAFAVNLATLQGMDGYSNLSEHGVQSIIAKSHDRSGFAIISYSDTENSLGSGIASFEWAANGSAIATASNDNQVNTWKKYVYVFSNKTHTAKIYIDGVLVKTLENFNQSFDSANQQDLYIGKFSDFWYPVNGKIDEVKLFNRGLSASEVKKLFTTKPNNQPKTISATLQGLSTYSATCTNNTTKQSVTVKGAANPLLDCTAAGLVVKSKQSVSISIKGKSN